MANENDTQAREGVQAPEGEPDYKALYEQEREHSRKWEQRSKYNVEKARKYDELAAGGSSVEERIAALESANRALEDEKRRGGLVKTVAKATGVPEAIVSALSATDEDGLTAQAKAVAEAYKVPGAHLARRRPASSREGRRPKAWMTTSATAPRTRGDDPRDVPLWLLWAICSPHARG